MTDADRIRGQVERGEVRVGPDAAREIAALAEAAYGAAWPADHPCRTSPVREPVADFMRGTLIDHARVAAAARSKPGQWIRVGEYRSSQSAKATAGCIRKAGGSQLRTARNHYAPTGAFEARTQLTEFGCDVFTRYVGAQAATAEDEAWADAVAALDGEAA
ncbi:hypothetical protein ABZY90_19785 [Streptomyces sp. NPDC006422]|uniref:hypothetical protein n=1 Tax=unclassified Streptomyces TaxID=2593676 RepID=UPI0033BF5C27